MRGVNQPPLASIVICVRDDLRIERCLDAIFGDGALGFDDPFEVIVIENHDNPTLGWLVDRFPIIYGVEPSIGMHRARQKGVELARGEFVVCTDADCIPQRGWLAEIVRPLEADPDVQVVGGGIEKVEPASWVELLQPDLGGAHAEPQFLPRISPLPFAVTANATFRRTQLLEVGGFDGDFRSGGDVDLSWRILSRGGSLVLAPDALVQHACRPTLRSFYRQYRTYSSGHALLFSKHRLPNARYCFDPYPVHLVTGALRQLVSIGRGGSDARSRCATMRSALLQFIEATALVDGAIRGSMRHRVLYL